MATIGVKKMLDVNKDKLEIVLKTAPDFDEDIIRDEEVDSRKLEMNIIINKLQRIVSTLQSKNDEWINLMAKMKGEERKKEEEAYESYTSGEDNFLQRMCEAEDLMDCLKAKLEHMNEKQRSRLTSNTIPGSNGTNESWQEQRVQVNLPTISLPMFDGNPLEFKSFWDQFNDLVHRHNIAAVTKFTYLLSTLQGRAKAAVEGLPVTSESYPEAIDIIQQKFGNVDVIRRGLYSQMENLPKCDGTVESVSGLTLELDKICRQLRAIGENPDHPALLFKVQQKLSTNILESIMIQKPKSGKWTMAKLQEALGDYVSIKEEIATIELESKLDSATGLQKRTMMQNSSTKGHSSRGRIGNRDLATKRCELCNGAHFPSECLKYPGIRERRNRLNELGLCLRCLRNGHMSRSCSYARPCFFCKGNHHQALCSRKEDLNNSWRLQPRQGIELQPRFYQNREGINPRMEMAQTSEQRTAMVRSAWRRNDANIGRDIERSERSASPGRTLERNYPVIRQDEPRSGTSLANRHVAFQTNALSICLKSNNSPKDAVTKNKDLLIREELEALKQELLKSQDKIQANVELRTQREKQFVQLKKDLDETTAAFESRIKELKQKNLKQVEEMRKKLSKELAACQKQLEEVKVALSHSKKAKIILSQENEDIRIKLEKVTAQCREMEKRQRKFDQQLNDEKNNVQKMTAERDQLAQELRDQESKSLVMAKEMNDMNAHINELERHTKASSIQMGQKVDAKLNQALNEVEIISRQRDELAKQLRKRSQSLKDMQQELDETRKQKEDAILHSRDLDRKIRSLETELRKVFEANAQLIHAKCSAETERDDLAVELANKCVATFDVEERKRLSARIAELEELVDEEQSKTDLANDKLKKAQNQIETCELATERSLCERTDSEKRIVEQKNHTIHQEAQKESTRVFLLEQEDNRKEKRLDVMLNQISNDPMNEAFIRFEDPKELSEEDGGQFLEEIGGNLKENIKKIERNLQEVTAQVMELCSSPDRQVRSVLLKTPSSDMIQQPINQIYPLEIRTKEAQQQRISGAQETKDEKSKNYTGRRSKYSEIGRQSHRKASSRQKHASGGTRGRRVHKCFL